MTQVDCLMVLLLRFGLGYTISDTLPSVIPSRLYENPKQKGNMGKNKSNMDAADVRTS